MTQALFVFLTLASVVSALFAIWTSQRCSRQFAEVTQLAQALRSERSKIAAHDSEIDRLDSDFRKLRGKFYKERALSAEHEGSSEPQETAADLKARLRKQLGLVPNRSA